MTIGSSHLRFAGASHTLRLTTDASLTAILEERPFFLDDTLTLLLGPDESVLRHRRRRAATSSRRPRRTGGTGCVGSRFRSNGRQR